MPAASTPHAEPATRAPVPDRAAVVVAPRDRAAARAAASARGARRACTCRGGGRADRAKSWSVPYVDVTLTPTFQFQDPQSNPARDVALAFVVADPEDACDAQLGRRLHAWTRRRRARARPPHRPAPGRRRRRDDLSFGGLGQRRARRGLHRPGRARPTPTAAVIERYDVTTIDLDIEGDRRRRPGARCARRAAALATLQDGARGRRPRRSTCG